MGLYKEPQWTVEDIESLDRKRLFELAVELNIKHYGWTTRETITGAIFQALGLVPPDVPFVNHMKMVKKLLDLIEDGELDTYIGTIAQACLARKRAVM